MKKFKKIGLFEELGSFRYVHRHISPAKSIRASEASCAAVGPALSNKAMQTAPTLTAKIHRMTIFLKTFITRSFVICDEYSK